MFQGPLPADSTPAAPPIAASLTLAPVPRQRALTARRARKPAEPDAELLELGRQWKESRARERALDREFDAIPDVRSEAHRAVCDASQKEASVGAQLRRKIVQLRATTWPGVRLKIDLACWAFDVGDEEFAEYLRNDEFATNDTVLASLTRDLRTWFAQPDPDAELLRLGELFEAAWGEQRELDAKIEAMSDAEYTPEHERTVDRASEKTSAIVSLIEHMRPTTLAGFVVKARACSWRRSGDPFDDGSFGDGGGDSELAGVIITDLLAIDGRPLPTVMAVRAPAVTKAA